MRVEVVSFQGKLSENNECPEKVNIIVTDPNSM